MKKIKLHSSVIDALRSLDVRFIFVDKDGLVTCFYTDTFFNKESSMPLPSLSASRSYDLSYSTSYYL